MFARYLLLVQYANCIIVIDVPRMCLGRILEDTQAMAVFAIHKAIQEGCEPHFRQLRNWCVDPFRCRILSSNSVPMLSLSKLNNIFIGYFDPVNIIFEDKNSNFRGDSTNVSMLEEEQIPYTVEKINMRCYTNNCLGYVDPVIVIFDNKNK